MVAPVEEQIHHFLIEQEEKRCRTLESEYNKNEKTQGKTVNRKVIAKPWVRVGEHALCQSGEILIMVDEYDYDLSDRAFQEYCSARGTLYVAGVPGSRYWEFFSDYGKPESEFLIDPYFQFAQEVNGNRHRYSDEDMKTHWKIV